MSDALDKIIEEGLKATAPAIALTVYHQGKRVIHRADGFLTQGDESRPVTEETLFDLASLTKLYTATTLLMEVAAGKIALDTPVTASVPEFGAGGPRPIGEQQNPHTLELLPVDDPLDTHMLINPTAVTFRHLLTHTAGLPPWRELYTHIGPTPRAPHNPSIPDMVPHKQRLERALNLICGYSFADVPGSRVLYSDLGLILLGAAVARIDKVGSLGAAITERVLRPGRLTDTMFNPTAIDRCAPTEFDKRWRRRRLVGEVHDENAAGLGGIAGHAGLFGTSDDVARFGQMWLDSIKGNGPIPQTIATDAVRQHAQTGLERRGLGWALRTSGQSSSGNRFSENSFGHTGFTGTSLWIDPEKSLVVSLLTNRVYHGRDADAITALRPKVHDAIVQSVVTA